MIRYPNIFKIPGLTDPLKILEKKPIKKPICEVSVTGSWSYKTDSQVEEGSGNHFADKDVFEGHLEINGISITHNNPFDFAYIDGLVGLTVTSALIPKKPKKAFITSLNYVVEDTVLNPPEEGVKVKTINSIIHANLYK